MKFGPLKPDEAVGGILAHSLALPSGKRLRKGLVIDEATVELLKNENISEITIAMAEAGDMGENEAAQLIAAQFSGTDIRIDAPSTGRVNLFADTNGIFNVSREIIDQVNAIDSAITIATLPDYSEVNSGRMIATIKIIPYCVAGESVETILSLNLTNALRMSAFEPLKVGLIATKLPQLKSTTMDKTRNLLDRRLSASGSSIVTEERVAHDAESVAQAIEKLEPLCDMLIVFGASAISDESDCIPVAIEQAGGEITRFGMPVDPGNLMLLAKLGDKPVIGAPGCARSPAENGFDWILARLLAGMEISSAEIAGLGVGGLLMETGSRPHPRNQKEVNTGKTAILIMAAGQSRRMGDDNKMTVEVKGKPMLRHVAEAAISSNAKSVSVVTGFAPEEAKKVLSGLDVAYIHNPDFEDGLSTSIRAGIAAISSDVDHVIILLGDMPFVTSEMIDRMIGESRDHPHNIVMATNNGKRGNPVLWPKAFFEELQQIEGDVGARHIIGANAERVSEVEIGNAAELDLDTRELINQFNNQPVHNG